MKNRMFSLIAFVVASIIWMAESAVHFFIHDEPHFEFIPADLNELWMRVVIILLIIAFGIFADSFSRKLVATAHQEEAIEKQEEAIKVYRSTMDATHHILNNLLNQIQLLKMTALETENFDQEAIELFDQSIDEASNLIDRLSHVENVTAENIWASVDPQQIANPSMTPSDRDKIDN